MNTFDAGAIIDHRSAKINKGMRVRRLSDHETAQAANTCRQYQPSERPAE
jgi:hypothetical protein